MKKLSDPWIVLDFCGEHVAAGHLNDLDSFAFLGIILGEFFEGFLDIF